MLEDKTTENHRALLLAVIQRAIRDAFWIRFANNEYSEAEIKEQKEDALKWLYSTSQDVGSLNWILDVLELDRDLKWNMLEYASKLNLVEEK